MKSNGFSTLYSFSFPSATSNRSLFFLRGELMEDRRMKIEVCAARRERGEKKKKFVSNRH